MSDTALVTLRELRAQYPRTPEDRASGRTEHPRSDETEATLIDAATGLIEQRCRNAFVRREHTYEITGVDADAAMYAEGCVRLPYAPVQSITSVTRISASEQDGDTLDAYDEDGGGDYYLTMPDKGFLAIYNPYAGAGYLGQFDTRYKVVYEAGLFASTAAVAADLKRLCIEVVKALCEGGDPTPVLMRVPMQYVRIQVSA